MAKTVFYVQDPFVMINGTDVSTYVKQATITMTKANLPVTASGDLGEVGLPGLSKDSFVFDLYQDKLFSVLDRILYDIYDAEAAVVIEVAHNGSTIGEDNPSWTGNAKLYNYSPLKDAVGAPGMVSPTFEVDGKITRAGT